jgi:flagellar protein FlaG
MSGNVTPARPVSEPLTFPSPAGDIGAPAVAAPAVKTAADYRLVIEEDEAAGMFVYKTLDRQTGEIVSQFPREEILRMRDSGDYQAGSVLKTQV